LKKARFTQKLDLILTFIALFIVSATTLLYAQTKYTGVTLAGATNLILVSGNEWTGAWSWDETWYDGANSEYICSILLIRVPISPLKSTSIWMTIVPVVHLRLPTMTR